MKKVYIILIFIGVGLVGSFLANKYRDSYYVKRDQRVNEQLRHRWSAGKFLNVDDHEQLISELLTAIRAADTNNSLSFEMASRLAERHADMIVAYHGGDLKALAQFIFPPDTRDIRVFDPTRMQLIRTAMRREGGDYAEIANESDEDAFCKWATFLASTNVHSICTNCWEKVNVAAIRLQVTTVTNGTVPSLHSVARKFEPLSTTSILNPITLYKPSTTELIHSGIPVTIAYLRVPVKMRYGKIGYYPVYTSMHWRNGTWVPLEIGLPSSESSIRVWF